MASRGSEEFRAVTQLGMVRYRRRYYCCERGHGGYAPFDRMLGLYKHASAGLQDWICYAAAKEAFGGAAETIAVFSEVALNHATVQDVAEWHGKRLYEAQMAETTRVFTPALRPPEPAGPERLYIEVDGAHVPKRGKDVWNECRVGVLFEVEPGADRHPLNVSYLAGMESWEAFGERLFAAAYARGVSTAREVVFLGDGAQSNWSIAELHFPHATHIVDFYHASEHIHTARLLRWTADDSDGLAWAASQVTLLKEGHWDAFIAAFDLLPGATVLQCKERKKATDYFEHNKARMHYAQYRARGLYIGSGMVESGCKLIVTQRMKITGAHWGDPGAHYMVNLRAALLNGDFRPDWILRCAA